MEVLKTKGAVEGVKEIAGDVIKTVVSALDDKATADDGLEMPEPAAEVDTPTPRTTAAWGG